MECEKEIRDKATMRSIGAVSKVADQLYEQIKTLEASLQKGLRPATEPAVEEKGEGNIPECEYVGLLWGIENSLLRANERVADIIKRLEV